MSLTLRIFLVYAAFVSLAGWFLVRTVLQEIKPVVRQSTEETLVDAANLLAEIVAPELAAGTLRQGTLGALLESYGRRRPEARIWGIAKDSVSHRVYVTDARGIVLVDSAGTAVGQDYSRWNDVYLTLRGRYGARSTMAVPGDEGTTVMHVAAPVQHAGSIIGVVTLAKPNRTLQPFIDAAQRKLALLGGALLLAGLVLGAALSWWLSAAIRRLTRYAGDVSRGERVEVPRLPGGELSALAGALDSMRTQLEGKAYVERYVQTLTHELKGPLSGIRGAAEVLQQDLPAPDKARFLGHIEDGAQRLQQLAERMLHLALVEQRRSLETREPLALGALVEEIFASRAARAAAAGIELHNSVERDVTVTGERFLLRQAIENLVDNALDFTPRGGTITAARVAGPGLCLRNDGPPIPDFALPRLTERFYSLPRPGTGRRSTGLGLAFVQEVAALHGGHLQVRNVAGGVEAELTFGTGGRR